MSEVPRNRSFSRANHSLSRSDSQWSQLPESRDSTEEVVQDSEEYRYPTNNSHPLRSGSADGPALYGRSPSSFSQSSFRRPSGASNMSNPRRPSGASAMSRRPSSSSGPWSSKTSNDSSHYSSYTASQSPISTPSTPKNRVSSRSRILASSAQYLGNSPPISSQSPPPHSRNSSFSTDAHLLPPSVSPVNHQAGKGSILVSSATGQSVLERKRRLAAASGNSVYDDNYTETSSISTTSQRRYQQNSDQGSNISSGDSVGNRRNAAKQAPTGLRNVAGISDSIPLEISSVGKDDSPNSLKKRLFGGLKKNSPKENSDASSISSRSRNYSSQVRPSTANDARSASMMEKDAFEMLDSEGHGDEAPSIRMKPTRITASASYPNRKMSEPLLKSQKDYNEAPTDYSRSTGLPGLAPPVVLQSDGRKRSNTSNSASLRSSPSEGSIKRSQNDSTLISDRPSSRGYRRHRTNSKGSASVHSVASFASNSSIPARTTSLKQNRTVPSSPIANFATLVSPSSSYKSIPTSPDLLASNEDTTLSSSPIKASLNRSSLPKHTSWRQSTNVSPATAAAGVSGASALAAIRASFGEPTRMEVHQADLTDQSDVTNSLSLAALRILEEPSSSDQTQDGGIEATMSKLIGTTLNEDSKLDLPTSQGTGLTSGNKEPLRPIKSPLRNTRQRLSTVASESGHESRSSVVPKENEEGITSRTSYIESYRANQLSPPRKSIEEMSVVDVLMNTEGMSASGSATNMTIGGGRRPSLHSRNKSQSSTSNNGSMTNLPGDSVLSLTATDDGQEGMQGKNESSKSSGKRYKTLAKVTPSVFNKGFGRSSSNKQSNSASASKEDVASSGIAWNLAYVDEDTPMVIPPSTSNGFQNAPKKKSIWRLGLGKDELSTGANSNNGHDSISSKNKLGMSIRGRKSDPQNTRPTIRRVFDHPNNLESPGNSSFADEQSLLGEESKSSTPTADRSSAANTTQSSFATMRNISRDSLHRDLGPMDSPGIGAPGTPQTPSENLPPELKRLIRRCNAIRELVETEKSYAADLAIVRDIYLARAKALAGFSISSPLTTPLSSSNTPVLSPAVGTPSSMQNPFQPSSANFLSFKGTPPAQWSSSSVRHQLSSETPLASPAQIQSSSTTLNSTGPSNRSSTYTVSSNTSSDMSFHWPPNGSSLPGTPSVGAPSSTYKSINASSGSPAPSLQQQQGKSTPISRIQTSVSGTPTLTNDGPLSSSDLRIIFAHLETCCTLAFDMTSLLNSVMGSVARERQPVQNGKLNVGSQHQDDDRIGNLFVSLMPRIEAVFTAYCSRHEASVLRFQDLINTSPKAANFFRECNEIARKNTTSWDLASLLIKPVQRVLKYPLLLRQIVGLTEQSHPDHAQLITALALIQTVADKINQVKRRKDLADYIITGRDRDVKAGTPSGLSTLPSKSKKKGGMLTPRTSNNANPDDSMLSAEALDKALEEYAELSKRFEALQSRVAIFGRQCGTWSHAVRECYYAQLRMLGYLRRVYTLRPVDEVEGLNANAVGNRAQMPSGPEDAIAAAYMDVLKTIINRSWRQMDTEIRTAILPMTTKIEKMFDAPRLVMGKVDERESDFVRARSVVQQEGGSGKSLDRKILENANGYIALQAQLIDEMPTFMRGIQLLLDVGVQAFARLQAAHLDEVRNLTIEFWSTKAGHEDEVEMIGIDEEDTLEVGPSLRNINPVRAFWESHRAYSQWSDSLSIARRGSDLSAIPSVDYDEISDSEEEDEDEKAEFEEALARANATELTSQRKPSTSSITQNISSKRTAEKANSNSGHGPSFLLPTSGRRPSGGMVGLMRTLSGTFSRENVSTPTNSSEGEHPPMPNDATTTIRMHRAAAAAAAASAAEQSKDGKSNGSHKSRMENDNDPTIAVSSLPPSLPSLVFRDDDNTGEGFFVQNSPIAFLDMAENVGNKEPYDASPNLLPVNRNDSISTTNSSTGTAADSSHDNSTLSVGHDGNTSTRSGSFVSAGSTRTFNLASRDNSVDRLNNSTILDSTTNSEFNEDGQFASIPSSSSFKNDQSITQRSPIVVNTYSPKSTSSSSQQRQKIQTLFRSKALKDGPYSAQLKEKHLGWPYVSYKIGDTFRVLSTDSNSLPGQTLLFGRSDVSGEMGWVSKVDFVKLDNSFEKERK